MRTPWTASLEMRTFCDASAAAVQRRSCFSVASPPARATRSASDGPRSTTIIRWPSATRGLGAAASPAAATSASRPRAGRLRVRIERKILGVALGLDEARGRGDHRRVVGAEREWRERGAGQRGTELRVGRDAADDGDLLRAGRLGGLERAADERADDRALVARGEIGAPPLELGGREVADGVEKCRLQPREGEVESRDARDREGVGLRIALAREPVEGGAARIAEAEEACALVEGLAGGVVDRRPDPAEAAVLAHVEKQRVAAAREQAE